MATITVSGVYAIRNAVNGRVYVGSSNNIPVRWREHRHRLRKGVHHSAVFQRSWDKHGEAAFIFSVVEVVATFDSLFAREQHWIDTLHAACRVRGLNRHPTAGGPRGFKVSAKARALMSVARRGRKLAARSAEHGAAISAAKKGQKHSPETRLKWSAMRRGKKMPPRSAEHKAAIGAAMKGKMSPEQRAILRARMKATKNQPKSTETRAKMSRSWTPQRKALQAARTAAMNRARATGDTSRQLTLSI